MAGQTTVLLLALYSFTILYYCHANEQQHQTVEQPINPQMYGFLRPALPLQYSRQIRIPSAVEPNSDRSQFEVDLLAQQPPIKRERSIFHEWQQCEFSPMSCLLRRRRQIY